MVQGKVAKRLLARVILGPVHGPAVAPLFLLLLGELAHKFVPRGRTIGHAIFIVTAFLLLPLLFFVFFKETQLLLGENLRVRRRKIVLLRKRAAKLGRADGTWHGCWRRRRCHFLGSSVGDEVEKRVLGGKC